VAKPLHASDRATPQPTGAGVLTPQPLRDEADPGRPDFRPAITPIGRAETAQRSAVRLWNKRSNTLERFEG
jgi:hypothetical protein